MAGVYKLKTCPGCNVEHRKRGIYCSQACSNSKRIISDETRKKLSAKQIEYQQTPEGVAQVAAFNNATAQRIEDEDKRKKGIYVSVPDDWAMDIDTVNDYDPWADDDIQL